MAIPILMYHSIDDDNFELSVSRKNFYNQMKLLSHLGFSSINLDELFYTPNLNRKIIITFDDGYKNNLTNALPILKKFKFKSTCYLVSNLIGSYNIWDENKKFYKKKELMNESDINEWLANDQFIGSHSLNHYNLQLIEKNSQLNEIISSKKNIEDTFKVNIDSFSYPYGRYNKSLLELVKSNYKFCITTSRSRLDLERHDRFRLPRVHVNKNTSLLIFFLKIFTKYEDMNYKDFCKDYK